MNDNILEPTINGLPPITDWQKVFLVLQQANEAFLRGATLPELGKQIIGDVQIQGADFVDLPVAETTDPVPLPIPETGNKFGFLADGKFTQPTGGTLEYSATQWGLTLFDGDKWVKKFTLDMPNNTVNELGVAVDKSLSQDISTQSIKSTSLPIKGTYASSVDANLAIGESCYNYNTKQIITRVSATKNIAYIPNLNVEYAHYDGRFFKWNGTDLVEVQKVLSALGTDDKRPVSQEISTQAIKSIPITFKGIYASTEEANIVNGESYYNHSLKEIVSRVSSTKVITYKPNLNTEYAHYDGRTFKWNGTDLVEIKKVLAILGADEKKPINQNVSSYGFKATSLTLKGAYASSTDANLSVGESCYNFNTKQIVSRVNADLADRLLFTPIVGTEYLIGNNRYCFNGTDLILSTEERRLRGFKTDFPNTGYAHKTTGVITTNTDISNTGFIPCVEGEQIRANALRTNGDAAVIVFYDAKKEIITSVAGTNPSGFWMETYIAPVGARYYVANTWNNNKDNSFVDSIWWKERYFDKKKTLVDIYPQIKWTEGGYLDKLDGLPRMNNVTLRYSQKIVYTGGDIEVKAFSGTNGALILFYRGDQYLSSLSGLLYNDKTTSFWEKHIPDGTTHFCVNADVAKIPVIKVVNEVMAANLVTASSGVQSIKGRYQFGSTANYNVLDTPLQAAFVFRKPPAIYALYDALMAQHPNYISKIDLDADMASIGINKPAGLDGYTFPMYKFRPAYAAVNPDHSGAQNYNEIKILISTGTHDEPYAIETLYNLMKRICNDWSTDVNMEDLRFNVTFYIIPVSNPWALDQQDAGEEGAVRVNWNKVDLNRNMATSDWIFQGENTKTYSGLSAGSEYENKMLVRQLEQIKPTAYIDFHNYGRDLQGNVTYLTSRDKTALDIIAEFLNKNARNLKKVNTDYPQAPETYLGFSQTTPERGGRSVYAVEQGIMGFVYECMPGYVWNAGVLQTQYKRHGDEVVMRDNLMGFTYFVLRVLHEVSLRTP